LVRRVPTALLPGCRHQFAGLAANARFAKSAYGSAFLTASAASYFNSTMPLKMDFATMIPANDNRPPDVARFYLQIGAIWLLPPALASFFVTVAWWLGLV
jgi:hypothetical protein